MPHRGSRAAAPVVVAVLVMVVWGATPIMTRLALEAISQEEDAAASIGIHQLGRLEANWARRRALWDYYLDALRDLPLVLPAPTPANICQNSLN